MGLDQYVYARKEMPSERPVDFRPGDPAELGEPVGATWAAIDEWYAEQEQLFYWRKHPNLHGWMQRLYEQRGGQLFQWSNFYGPVALISEDIDALEQDVCRDALPHTEGFFFGSSRAEDKKQDLEFIAKARTALASGLYLHYSSSW